MNRVATGFLFGTLLLAACGGGGGGSVAADCFKEYWDGTVGVCLPRAWVVIDAETLRQRGVPDDTVVGFQAEEATSGQFLTVTVTREPLVDLVAPTTYSDASMRSVSVLPGYELIDTTRVNVDSESIDLHIFKAQPIADEPKRRFYQLSTVVEGVGYTVTGVSPVSIDDDTERQIVAIVSSATFVDREAVTEGEE